MERLQKIYHDAGAPGAKAFRDTARGAGIDMLAAEPKAFVAQQISLQVFKQRIASDGKQIPSGGREDMRWQMDLMDYSRTIAQPKGHRYVMIAVDNYSPPNLYQSNALQARKRHFGNIQVND